MHAAQVAFPLVNFVARIAAHGKKVGQPRLDIAFEDFELLDFGQRLAAHRIGRDAFDLQRHRRFCAKRQAERHGGFQIWDLGLGI